MDFKKETPARMRIRQAVKSPIFRACVIVLICYLLCLLMDTLTYLTNDDTGIQNTLCGTYTGSPYYRTPT